MAKRTRPISKDFTVGWICALPIELSAALEVLDEEYDDFKKNTNYSNVYKFGRISEHSIVMCCLPMGQIGTNPAAEVASHLVSDFPSVKFGLMVGIGGGVPSEKADIRLGDVVVSKPNGDHGGVVQYDRGTNTPTGFRRTGFLNSPPDILLKAVATLDAEQNRGKGLVWIPSNSSQFTRAKAGSDVLFKANYDHVGGVTCKRCSKGRIVRRQPRDDQSILVHCGTIASGNQIMRNGTKRDEVSRELGDVLCFEMEAAGVMNSFPCLVIRGICDYADSHKNKRWQPYAAITAAAYAKRLLASISVTKKCQGQVATGAHTREKLQSAVDNLDLDHFLKNLSVVPQAERKSKIAPAEFDDPMFHWVFWNLDFAQWRHSTGFRSLWLCGPPKTNLHQVSSYIVDHEMKENSGGKRFILYFFCSSDTKETPSTIEISHTLLFQIICASDVDKKASVAKRFLGNLLGKILARNSELGVFKDKAPNEIIEKILNRRTDDIWASLATVLEYEKREFAIVIDGVDKVSFDNSWGIHTFIENLQRRVLTGSVLFTSQSQADINEKLYSIPYIEYDKEKTGLSPFDIIRFYSGFGSQKAIECLGSLQFDSAHYSKISTGHLGSFEWIWKHSEYKLWSTSDASHLLYVEGKPGSGKSSLTKYISNNLLMRETTRNSILANFFYSNKEGKLQTSHHSMLRSVLYNIIEQDESFFYHKAQAKYRDYLTLKNRDNSGYSDWPYDWLKEILLSIKDYSVIVRLHLLIDAVDESDEKGRSDILSLLSDICLNAENCIVKVFMASRPLGHLEPVKSKCHSTIFLQNETEKDIKNFADSFLTSLQLPLFHSKAMEYITENSQGVFLWVNFVRKELLVYAEDGSPEEDFFNFLKGLPTDLESYYTQMFENIAKERRHVRDGIKIFQFVLYARRSLTENELLHALGIPDDPSIEFEVTHDAFRKRIPTNFRRRLVRCTGNFLEVRPPHSFTTTSPLNVQIERPTENGTVQFIHQTVRDFFLQPGGCIAHSEFSTTEKYAHKCIAMTCIRYLMLCSTNNTCTFANKVPHIRSWTARYFENYAQYLNQFHFANYALCYLPRHIDGCEPDVDISSAISKFIDGLFYSPGAYLLESWVGLHFKNSLNNKLDTAAGDFRNNTLFTAVRKGFLTATEMLLTLKTDVNLKDSLGRTPLWCAAEIGHEGIVRLLLEQGAYRESTDRSRGQTPLSLAATNGHVAVVKLLLEKGADLESKDILSGQTPFSWAASNGHEAIVRLFLEKDVDLESKNHVSQTPLSLAARNGHEAVVRLLLEKGAEFQSQDWVSWTPLSWAASSGHEAVVRLLLGKGASIVSNASFFGKTPFSWAASNGYEAVLRLLRGPGVSFKSEDQGGQMPLSWDIVNNLHNQDTQQSGGQPSNKWHYYLSLLERPLDCAVQDYQMRLQLLDQANKRDLVIARHSLY